MADDKNNSTRSSSDERKETGKVISTRDVIFNEIKFFNGKQTNLNAELITKIDTLIQKIKLPAS